MLVSRGPAGAARGAGGILDFDAIVIGTGAGGGAAAHELVRAGRRVLVLERGGRLEDPELGRDERRMILEGAAADDRALHINGALQRPINGGVTGGSTALYGACLLRPAPADFQPGRFYADHLPRHLWDWPLAYEELAPYFDRAEDLFGVSGDHRVAPPHLGRRMRPYPGALPEYEPISQRLASAFADAGLAPFPLPLAIDFERCLRCPGCPGFACPTGARASSYDRAIAPAVRNGALTLWERCEAERLIVERGAVRAVRVRHRDTGREEEVRAEAFLLGAGAVGTPLLLLRSGLEGRSDQVGRNHMCHLGAVPVGFFLRPTGAAERFAKQVGLSDFYLGRNSFQHKLGYAQAIPVPGPLSVAEHAPVPLPGAVARALHRRMIVFAGSIEDLPQPSNRVRIRPDGSAHLTRRFHAYDVFRGAWLARRLASLLRRAGAVVSLSTVANTSHRHLGHQVGTCRFGRDPRHSVLDAQCRLHGHPNVYVVDGSFMPTSLGVGPALTIAANALRVASHVAKELR